LKKGVVDRTVVKTYQYTAKSPSKIRAMDQPFLDSAAGLKLVRRYDTLKAELTTLGWITNGSVTPNHPGYWRWTRKVNGKTVAVALSSLQADLFKEAIASHRKLESILEEMRAISQEVLVKSAPGTIKKPRAAKRPKTTLN
jgi:hypothetical protein